IISLKAKRRRNKFIPSSIDEAVFFVSPPSFLFLLHKIIIFWIDIKVSTHAFQFWIFHNLASDLISVLAQEKSHELSS
ncbi:hypothetical protein ACTND0_05015, partial [Lactobacillus amylovorus]|uniref:hypothetical protein n=1 Tax=Lactobacillus amylovorus TaxID=1604 RepID=UPI002A99DF84|nr:hypothetical protein [Lactobacillus amylovorus]